MKTRFNIGLGILLLLLSFSATATDDDDSVYDRVSLTAGAEAQVDNDLLSAVLFSERDGRDAARLADEVNSAVEWGVKEAGKEKTVRVQTLDYRTHPIYNKQTLKGWKVRQSIRLESADTSALSNLIGRLQNRLSVETITYKLSPEARQAAENALIREAIDAFTQRARLITEQLDRSGYRLVTMDVGSSSSSPRPMMRAMAMSVAEDAAPTLKAGTQKVNVRVTGTIELKIQ